MTVGYDVQSAASAVERVADGSGRLRHPRFDAAADTHDHPRRRPARCRDAYAAATRTAPPTTCAPGSASSSARSATRQRLAAESPSGVGGVLPLVFFRSRLFGRFAVSMPFLNYGGVLADTPEVERALLDRAVAETRDAGGSHLELRHTRQLFPELAPKRHKVAMRLPLEPTPDAQWEALDRKVRNQVRKGEKSGLDGRASAAPSCCRRLLRRVRAQHARPRHAGLRRARSSRRCCDASPIDRGCSSCSAKGSRWRPRSCYWHGATIEVPWASALRESNPLCANVLLYWQMLKFAVERGFTHVRLRPLDARRRHVPLQEAVGRRAAGAGLGVLDSAGGAPLPDLSPENPKFDLAIRAWQRLPVRWPRRSARSSCGTFRRSMLSSRWRSARAARTCRGLSRCCCGCWCGCAARGRIRQRRHHAAAELRDLGLQRGRRHPRASSRTRWRSTTRATCCEIVVISDCSNDGTDEIVARVRRPGVCGWRGRTSGAARPPA